MILSPHLPQKYHSKTHIFRQSIIIPAQLRCFLYHQITLAIGETLHLDARNVHQLAPKTPQTIHLDRRTDVFLQTIKDFCCRHILTQLLVIRQVEIQAEILLDGWHQLKLAVALHHQLGLLGIKKVEGSIAAFCLTPTMPSRS